MSTTGQLVIIEEQIQAARERITFLESERTALLAEAEGPLRDIAIMLHASECRFSHEDGCAWYYEEDWLKTPGNPLAKDVWTDTVRSHNRWLRTALERIAKAQVSAEEFLAALRVVNAK